MDKVCEWCQQPFVGRKNARYCAAAHYKPCDACGTSFLIKDMKRPPKACSKACADALTAQNKGNISCTCELCGKDFKSDRATTRFCGEKHYRECVNCGEQFEIVVARRISKTCSKKCAAAITNFAARNEKSAATNMQKYGVANAAQLEAVKMRKKETTLKNYGVENPSQSPIIKQRRIATTLERYGVENGMQSEVVKARLAEANIERFGVANVFSLPEFQSKAKKSLLEKYGVENIFQLPAVQKKAAENSGRRISRVNKYWHEKLKAKLGVDFEYEVSFGTSSYADLGFENVLIDINPSFTHNSSVSFVHLTGRCTVANCQKTAHMPRRKLYHQERALAAQADGKILMQYFDWFDEDVFMNMVEAKLSRSKTRIWARKCELREITQRDANRFLQENHLMGKSNGQSYCLGMFYDDELVHVQTYGKARMTKKVEWEAIRSASKLGVQILGAFSKCDKKFFAEKQPASVVSYIDLSISQGTTEKMFDGWSLSRVNQPSATWVNMLSNDAPAYIRDSAARRVSADKLLGLEPGEKYPLVDEDGDKITNAFVLLSEGYLPVYDAGTLTMHWKKP